MERRYDSVGDSGYVRAEISQPHGAEAESHKQLMDSIFQRIDELEEKVIKIEKFFSNLSKNQDDACKGSSSLKDKDKEKHVSKFKKEQRDAQYHEVAVGKRMQDLMHQFGTLLDQITQHRFAQPFMQPVDVQGLGLHDYCQIIDKPMDFATIKNKMEAQDSTGYKNVREVYSDVRLIFKNAMKYNSEGSDIYIMAKALLDKFEVKWLQLLPKVTEEEKRRQEEEAEAESNMQLSEEAAHAKRARDISNELYNIIMHLEPFKENVAQKCRKMSCEEKRKLGEALTRLSPEHLDKALEIVSRNNPGFLATTEDVFLDLDDQDALEFQGKGSVSEGGTAALAISNGIAGATANNVGNKSTIHRNKRRRDVSNVSAKAAKRK